MTPISIWQQTITGDLVTNPPNMYTILCNKYTSLMNIETEKKVLEFVMLRKESEPHLGLVITQAAGGRTILL